MNRLDAFADGNEAEEGVVGAGSFISVFFCGHLVTTAVPFLPPSTHPRESPLLKTWLIGAAVASSSGRGVDVGSDFRLTRTMGIVEKVVLKMSMKELGVGDAAGSFGSPLPPRLLLASPLSSSLDMSDRKKLLNAMANGLPLLPSG